MRFSISSGAIFGIWFLFVGITMPTPWSTQYFMGLAGSVVIGVVVGLIYGEWKDARKENRHADAEKDAHRS